MTIQTALDEVAGDLLRDHPERVNYWTLQRPRLHETLRVATKCIAQSQGKRLLDVGCNPPFIISTLAKLGHECTGVDIEPAQMEDAQRQYGLDVKQVNIETEPLPFDDGSFDIVLFTEVFEHLRINPVKTIAELFRILAPGGILVLSTPNLNSLNGIYKFLVRGTAYSCANDSVFDQFNLVNKFGYFGHIREYTRQEVAGFLKRIGFDSVNMHFHGGATRWGLLRPLYWLLPWLKPEVHYVAHKP